MLKHLIIFCFFGSVYCLECFINSPANTTWKGNNILSSGSGTSKFFSVNSTEECLNSCLDDISSCKAITFKIKEKECYLFSQIYLDSIETCETSCESKMVSSPIYEPCSNVDLLYNGTDKLEKFHDFCIPLIALCKRDILFQDQIKKMSDQITALELRLAGCNNTSTSTTKTTTASTTIPTTTSTSTISPTTLISKEEGEQVVMSCEPVQIPDIFFSSDGYINVQWMKDGIPIQQVPDLAQRAHGWSEDDLVISQVKANDSGVYVCDISIVVDGGINDEIDDSDGRVVDRIVDGIYKRMKDGIYERVIDDGLDVENDGGLDEQQQASITLSVEYPARVSHNPGTIYLSLHKPGIIPCYVESNPGLTFITWIKDRRIYDIFEVEGITTLTNGSQHITNVTEAHGGNYTCTPYNIHGTTGSSSIMQVLITSD